MKVTIEFLGLARQATQTRESDVEIDGRASYRDVLTALAALHPSLVGPVILPSRRELTSSFMLNVGGKRSLRDLDTLAEDGQHLLLMFTEAGG